MFNSPDDKIIFNLIIENPTYILAYLTLNLISVFLDLLIIVILITLVVILSKYSESTELIQYPTIIQYFYSLIAENVVEFRLDAIILMIFICFVSKNIVNYLNTTLELKHTKHLVCSMQSRALDILTKVNINYFQQTKVQDILFKLNREIDRTALAGKSVQKLLMLSATISVFIGLLVSISWQLTCTTLLLWSLIIVINQKIVSSANNARILTSEKSQISTYKTVEFLTKIRSIEIIASEPTARMSIARALEDKNRTWLVAQMISAATKPTREILSLTMVLMLILVSYSLYPSVTEFAPIISIYLIVLFRMIPWVEQINRARLQFINTKPSAVAVANFLDTTNKQFPTSGDMVFSKLQIGIEFKAVTFAYPQHAQIVLDKVSFSIPQGKTTVLIGSPKSGKSTLVDLLTRFYEPIEGKILLDGVEFDQYQLASLRKAIGVINRNTLLFDDSLAYNIAYGLKNVTRVDLLDAVKQAGIDEFVSQLPEGLATPIGRQGLTLSDAQRLRIGIARAFLRDPEILILDEPIDVLDSSLMAQESIEIFEALRRDRTTLIITSQLNIAKKADLIIVLNRGKITERGTHEELVLRQGSIYQRLYSTQFKTSQQSRQLKLAQKIARKLARQTKTNNNLVAEIQSNLNTLLDRLQLIDEGLFEDDREQNRILDESYLSAKNVLLGLREYEQTILRGFDDSDRDP